MELKTKYQSIVFMGKITSGKSTQAREVVKKFGGFPYSNGNKVRETAKKLTGFGNRVKDMYENGYLMPEWIASYWMTHALISEHENDVIVFEGVAKKPHEAQIFDEIHNWMDRPYIVFNLEIPDDIVRSRSASRARDVADTPKSVEKRLEEYHTYTAESIEFFQTKGTLVNIDGLLPLPEVTKHIFNHLQ